VVLALSAQEGALWIVGGLIALVVVAVILMFAWGMLLSIIKHPGMLMCIPVGGAVVGLIGTALTGAVLGSILVGCGMGLVLVLVGAFMSMDEY